MNRLTTAGVRENRARVEMLPDPCRPVRMQAAGWCRHQQALTAFAWRKAFRRRAIWRRAILGGLVVAVLSGAAGDYQPWTIGTIVMIAALLVQFWQHVDERSEVERNSLN